MERPGNMNEQELLQRLRKRDNAAFETVYNLYWPVMYNHALRMLGDEEDARDIVQELFITFHSRLEKLHEDTHIAGYLFIALRNKILNLIRLQRVRYDYLEMMRSFVVQSGENNVWEVLSAKELRQAVDTEVQFGSASGKPDATTPTGKEILMRSTM